MIWKLIAAGCFALIATVSLLPGSDSGGIDLPFSSSGFIEHLFIYAVLGFSVFQGFTIRWAFGILVLVCLLGIGFEWIQGAWLERTCNPGDILANVLGLLAGLAAAGLLGLLGRKKNE